MFLTWQILATVSFISCPIRSLKSPFQHQRSKLVRYGHHRSNNWESSKVVVPAGEHLVRHWTFKETKRVPSAKLTCWVHPENCKAILPSRLKRRTGDELHLRRLSWFSAAFLRLPAGVNRGSGHQVKHKLYIFPGSRCTRNECKHL